jgi:hypothetical protein
MKKNNLAKTAKEFDRRFDEGEDITDLIDISKAVVTRGDKKVRLTIDVSASLVQEIDDIRMRIGVDRGALVKIWLYERVKQEKGVQ